MSDLMLADSLFPVSPERGAYNEVRLKYQKLADQAAADFAGRYTSLFKDMDAVHENCTDVAMSYVRVAMDEAIRDLIALGIMDIDDEEFAESYLQPVFSWDNDFGAIDEKYMAIVLKAEEMDAYRIARREDRGRWVGGGFGVGGAIKGAAQAGAMNLVVGAGHGIWNLAAKGVQAVGDLVRKTELFEDPNTRAQLIQAVFAQIFNVHFALVSAANDKRPSMLAGFVSGDDEAKAKRLFENVNKGRVTGADAQKIVLEALALNPYDPALYGYWLSRFGDANGQLERLAAFFGIRLVAEQKRALVAQKQASLDLTTPEACKANLPLLEAYATSVGYVGFADDKAQVLAAADERDRLARTVDGVTHVTSEAAIAARQGKEARTVKGVTYGNLEEAERARTQRSVGLLLGIGIFVAPYLFSFFTLRKGHTPLARGVAFGWLGFILLSVLLK